MPKSNNAAAPRPTGAPLLRTLAITAALGIAGAVATAPAQAASPQASQAAAIDTAASQLTAASADGPAALLQALDRILRANPALAATPDSAAALARAAGAPVGNFVGATVPVYRSITDRIAAAAPPASAAAVRASVADTLSRMAAADTLRKATQPGAPPRPATNAADVGSRGYRVGSFTIYPDIQSALVFDNNVYATRNQHHSDVLATISPKLSLESNWQRHSLTAEAQTDLTGYARSPHENSVDWNANVEGRIDATATTQIVGGATVIASHEDRTSPDAVDGYSPTPYLETNGYLGVVQRLGDFSVRVGGAIERIAFDNVDSAHGIINNHDRNRNRYTFGTLVRYEANPAFRPFVEVMGDLRRYDDRVDDFGYARSSDGYRAGVGALFRLSTTLRGQVFAGVMARNPDDPAFHSITAATFDGSLRWQATTTTTLVAYADRSIEETTLVGSPGYIYTVLGGRVEQKLTDKLTGLVRLAWGNSDFQQSTRHDEEADMSTGLHYRLTPKVTLGVDYRYTRRWSNVTLANYDRSELYFRLGSQF